MSDINELRPAVEAAGLNAISVQEVLELLGRLEEAESDALEQARLNGIGASREAVLLAKLEAAEKERDNANAAAAGVALQAIELESKLEVAEKTNRGWLRANATGGWIDNLRIENDTLRVKIDQLEEDTKAVIRAANSGAQPAPSVPDGVAEALQRLIESGAVLGPASSEDALLVARYRQCLMACAPSVPECPYPCGWRNLLKLAIEDGAYLARSINTDEPVTENARAVTMRIVLMLRDVLMAINNAAPEAKQ